MRIYHERNRVSYQPDHRRFSYQKRIRCSIGASIHLEEVAVRYSAEDANEHGREHEGAEQTLEEDGVLDLAKSRLLDPDLAVEDLADDIALLVPRDPWLVLPRVAGSVRADSVCRVLLCVVALWLVVRREELPRP